MSTIHSSHTATHGSKHCRQSWSRAALAAAVEEGERLQAKLDEMAAEMARQSAGESGRVAELEHAADLQERRSDTQTLQVEYTPSQPSAPPPPPSSLA